jgi:ornithine decarboxylase
MNIFSRKGLECKGKLLAQRGVRDFSTHASEKKFWDYLKHNGDNAVYRYYSSRLNVNATLFRQKFPGIQPYYAIKSNNHPSILSGLVSQGFGFDCASLQELSSVSHTVSPKIFANPFKMESHLRYAHKTGIRLLTADCHEELDKIGRYHPSAEVVLRIAVDDSQSICKFNKKFGMVPNCDNLDTFFTKLQKMKQRVNSKNGINGVGVSFHVGSGCLSSDSYRDAIGKSRFVFYFSKQYGFDFKILDIGGGFVHKKPLLNEVSEAVIESLSRYGFRDGTRLIAEPGRFMVANVADLYVKVVGRKQEGDYIKYYINSSVYGPFNCKIFDYANFKFDIYRGGKKITPLVTYPSSLFGVTCDSLDVIIENTRLPELQIDDYLCFHHMGAYTYSASSEFNGIPLPLWYDNDRGTPWGTPP